jgi:hypothetical protein
MAFFPLANTSKAAGYCTLHNYPPNNWEPIEECQKFVWAMYSDGKNWITKNLGQIGIGESITLNYNDIYQVGATNSQPLILLQFRKTPLPELLTVLPDHEFLYNKIPEWRATVGFALNKSQTSYQGEINPFPAKASLLTFHPFIQYQDVNNYFLFLNAEKSPVFREEEIEIYEGNSKKYIDRIKIKSNSVNLIPLDSYDFSAEQLPVFICRSMAGIPFGLAVSQDKQMLSLEHTHPPASFAVHGERFKVQGEIKRQWFNILNTEE